MILEKSSKVIKNKIYVSREEARKIRSMFFRKIEMSYIVKDSSLNENVIRRIVRENNWIEVRLRYFRFLCFYAYSHKIPLIKISEMTGVSKGSLFKTRRKYKIPAVKSVAWNSRRTEEINKLIIDDYNSGMTGQQVAKKYGYKLKESVYQILKKYNVPRRTFSDYSDYNRNFFKTIDSHDKAYILGLIMSDGYILKNYNGFGIQLVKNDGYLLNKIAAIIGESSSVADISYDGKRKTMPNAKDMTRLGVHNSEIAMDLKMLGVVRNKSKIIRYNGCVSKDFCSSFFRGLIDGDGSIGVAKNKNIWCVLVSSSEFFIKDLIKLSSDLGFTFSLNRFSVFYGKDKKECKMFAMRVSGGNSNTVDFLKWIYSNKGDLYLRRKYEKVQHLIM